MVERLTWETGPGSQLLYPRCSVVLRLRAKDKTLYNINKRTRPLADRSGETRVVTPHAHARILLDIPGTGTTSCGSGSDRSRSLLRRPPIPSRSSLLPASACNKGRQGGIVNMYFKQWQLPVASVGGHCAMINAPFGLNI